MASNKHGYRLASGGLVNRNRSIEFTYNGNRYKGFEGDTLASALIANGVDLIGRSFKYHRPRGFYGVGLEDPSSMLSVEDAYGYEPALRAGQVPLSEGLDARSVTGWPSPNFDLGAAAQLVSSVLGAGFYYKTFMWPNWKLFEPMIRKSTGFGRPNGKAETRRTHHRHAVTDVLIIGAGPAGLAAARSLADTNLHVMLVEDQSTTGGSLRWEKATIGGRSGETWANDVSADLAKYDNVTVLTSTMVTAAYEGNAFTMVQSFADDRGVREQHLWKVKARHVVLATGMVDRPLLFEGNDRPGIMLSSAVRRLIGEFGVAPADRIAVYTNNDSGYLTALAAREAGIEVAAIIDTRSQTSAIHASEAKAKGVACLFETQIDRTLGYKRLSGVKLRGRNGASIIRCSGLAISGGWTPMIQLAGHRGVKPSYDETLSMFLAKDAPDGWSIVGGAAGTLDLESTLDQAETAARLIAAQEGVSPALREKEAVVAGSFGSVEPIWVPKYGSTSRMWIDLQNDVKASDVELAARENYVSVEHLKRYTTLGMGTDQGRTSNVNGLAVMAGLTGREINAVGTTTFRPPYSAIRMSTIANRRTDDLHQPRRILPANTVHETVKGAFEDFGWERPDWYKSNGPDRESAVSVEMAAVRNHVGVFDGSSLGKIEVTGPDAARFLSYFYISNMATLKPERVRYSVMLKDDGIIFDDGVVACLAENHFLAGPTSGNAEAVAAWFERWRQTEWPSMRVAISTVTANWASIAIAGPRARDLLARLKPDFDYSAEAFPHMQVREGHVAGVPARVARVSFTGELQYEISVPARYASSLLEVLLKQDGDLIPKPVGMEAWLRLRLEKGYIHLGSDTNGRTTPLDVGMGVIISKRKDDFIGKRALRLAFETSPEKEQLVGLVALDGHLHVGARILAAGHNVVPCHTDGYVTSACNSPSVGKWIGMALIERGQSRDGETVTVYSNGTYVRCKITNPNFYDPENARLHA